MRYGFTAQPGPDRPHRYSTPLLGGIAVIAVFLGVSVVACAPQVRLIVAVAALMALGVIDDGWSLTPKTKLFWQTLIALVFILAGRGGNGGGNERFTGWWWLDIPLILFWLVTTTNAFNLIDGLDGLAAGIGIIDSLAIAVAAALTGQTQIAIMAAILAGSLFGFLRYNLSPAEIFMGDAGALPVGFLLGVLSTHVLTPDRSVLSRCAFPMLIMLVPLLDTAVVSITRLAIGKPLSSRAVDHSHHRLLSLGLSDRKAVRVLWTLALLPAIYALGAVFMPRPYLVVTLPIVCVAIAPCLFFMIDQTFESNPPGSFYGRAKGIARPILALGYKRRAAEALTDALAILAAYLTAVLVTHDFVIDEHLLSLTVPGLPWVVLAASSALIVTGTYRRMWKFFGLSDLARIALAVAMSASVLMILSLGRLVPFSPTVTVVFAVLLFNLLTATRVSFWSFKEVLRLLATPGHRVVIVGAGALGEKAARDLARRPAPHFHLIGFLDDDAFKHDKLIAGVPVLGPISEIDAIYSSKKFDEVMVAAKHLEENRLTLILNFAERLQMPVRRYSIQLDELSPPLSQMIAENGLITGQKESGLTERRSLRAVARLANNS